MADPATIHPASSSPLDPHTPTDPTSLTPALASPNTPHPPDAHIQTPRGKVYGEADEAGSSRHVRIVAASEGMDDEGGRSEGVGVGEGVGLGFGEIDQRDGEIRMKRGLMLPPPVDIARPSRRRSRERGEGDDDDTELPVMPDADALRRIKDRVKELRSSDGGEISMELCQMLDSLVDSTMLNVPFMQSQLEAQRETIRTLQQQGRMSSRIQRLERERHTAERQSWRATVEALQRQRDSDIASGVRPPRRLLDLDVGYHQELESANKRLEMDNRLMGPRLADTQQQVDRLVNELRHLRAHVVLATDPFGPTIDINATPRPALHSITAHPPTTPGPGTSAQGLAVSPFDSRRSRSPTKIPGRASNTATMGDARAEHLLLAARKVRAMRARDERIGRLTFDELQRNGILGPEGGVSYREGYAGAEDVDGGMDDDDSDLEEKPFVSERDRRASWSTNINTTNPATSANANATASSSRRGPPSTPLLKPKNKRPPVTPASKSTGPRQHPHTTPGGNFTDLLRAAELATRPTTPTRTIPVDSRLTMTLPIKHQHQPPSATRSTTTTWRERGPGRGRGNGLDGIDGPDEDETPDGSPVKRPRRLPPGWTSDLDDSFSVRPKGSGEREGALDLLLQASQIDQVHGGAVGQVEQDGRGGERRSLSERSVEPTKAGATFVSGDVESERARLSGSGGLQPAIDLRSAFAQDEPERKGDTSGAGGGGGEGGDADQSMNVGDRSPFQTTGTLPGQGQGQEGLATPHTRHRDPAPPALTPASASAPGTVREEIRTPARTWIDSPFDHSRSHPHATGHSHQTPSAHYPPSPRYPATVGQGTGTGAATQTTSTPRRPSVFEQTDRRYGTATPGLIQGYTQAHGQGPYGAFDSPTGTPVPGLGKYAHLTSTAPARRVRSPYLKWTLEEDELLARAVAIHGEKWDLVSKGVPTRSYHQVRQRWLRKTGAFDKKNAGTPLSGMGITMGIGMGDDGDGDGDGDGGARKVGIGADGEGEDEIDDADNEHDHDHDAQRSGSPTPAPGGKGGKKRKLSLTLRTADGP